MPRSIWSGSVAFGLVSVPVRMESAVEEHKLHFNYVHEPDGGRIGYQKVCKAEDDKPVPDDEVVKAFEVKKGKWVYLEDEDFASAALDRAQRTIDIHAFVQAEEIDPVYFERSYFLTPQDGAEKVYALLARALEETGLVAVATFVMRDRQHLACLRVRERALQLERMHFADEIRPAKGVAPKGARVSKDDLDLAIELVQRLESSFDPKKYEDTYRDALMKIIRAKERGKTVEVAEEEPEVEEPVDLLAALRESVEAAGKARRGKSGRRRSRKAA
jgi:DNA end-binding protein Ku